MSIEKLVYGGDGLARIPSGPDQGAVVLVPFVLPGEKVRVEIERAKNDLLRGRVVEILDPSPVRVNPLCPYFLRCGGCHYQHAGYEFQLHQKREILREVLRRVGKIEHQDEIAVLSGPPWEYRNRAQLHIGHGRIGYFGTGTQTLVAIDHCPISSPRLNQAIAALAKQLPTLPEFEARVELFTNETDVQVNVLDPIPPAARRAFAEIGSRRAIEYGPFRVSRNSFFQVNRFLINQLVETAVSEASGRTVLDLYAGVGLFTLALASRFQQVTAVERGASAFRDLEFNMHRAGIKVRCEPLSSEAYLAGLDRPPDFLLADPPRTGLGKGITRDLIRLRPPQLAIVSCDPATLARDLAPLLAAGFRIKRVCLIDLFPQTFHLETVVRLTAS